MTRADASSWATRLASEHLRFRPSAGAARLVLVVSWMLIVLIAAVDRVTGFDLSLAVFYLLPVSVVSAVVSARWGYATAGAAAIAWTIADLLTERHTHRAWILAANTVVRWVTLSIVVALIVGFRQALDSARASDERTRRFLADAAHQLRTPIAAIQASAEAVVMTGSSDPELLANMVSETNRAGSLIAGLLRIARLEQGGRTRRETVALWPVVTEEIERVRSLAPDVRLASDAHNGLPAITGDPEGIRNLVANLLDNAIRHARTKVDVSVRCDGAHMVLTVSDDGIGLPEGTEVLAFERFVSLDGRGGSGLGLAIARAVAHAHGGTLVYERPAFVYRHPLPPPERPRRHRT